MNRPVVALAEVRDGALSLDEVYRAVRDDSAGALVVFLGVVRDLDRGRPVELLEYSCHPSALEAMGRVAQRYAQDGRALRLGLLHRVGRLAVGDLAVVVAVAGEHRREAFEVCAGLVDELKASVPIWKHQVFTDGTDEWVGAP